MALTIEWADTGELLDVSEGTTVAQTIESLPLSAFEKRRRTYTNAVKLPNTPRNRRILGMIDGRHSRNTRVNIFFDGNPVMTNAVLVVTDLSPETLSVQLYSDLKDLFDILGDLTVGELYADENHEITPEVVQGAQAPASPFLYKMFDYGMTTQTFIGDGFYTGTDARHMFPQIPVQQIITRANAWLKTQGAPGRFVTAKINNAVKGLVLVPGIGMPQGVDPVDVVAGGWQGTYTRTLGYTTLGSAEIKETGRYIFDVSQMAFRGEPAYSSTETNFYVVPKIELNGKTITNDQPWVNTSGVESFDLKKGDVIVFSIRPFIGAGGVKVETLWISDASLSVTFDAYYRDFSVLFPGLTVKQVITDLIQRTNSVIAYINGSIHLLPTESDAPPLDFTKKYAGDYSETLKVASFKKTNFFRYKDTYRAQGVIRVLDAGTDGEAEVVTAPYGALDEAVRLSGDGAQRVARYVTLEKRDDGTVKGSSERPPALAALDTSTPSEWSLQYKDQVVKITSTSSLNNDTPSYQDAIEEYFPTIRKALAYPRQASFLLWLTPEDLQRQLPYRIYIDHLNAVFLLMQITNYVPGKFTKVTALRF